MLNLRVCPNCGSQRIRRVRRNWSGKTREQTYSVPNLTFHECPDCGEKIYGREAMRSIEAVSPAFTKPVRRSA